MHGLALNVDVDLSHFEHIVPCGIADRSVTSLAQEVRARSAQEEGGTPPPSIPDVQALLLAHFADVFGAEIMPADPAVVGVRAEMMLEDAGAPVTN